MAFKMKKPIWHGTDSHKQAIKSGAPSKYDYLSDQGDLDIKSANDKSATVEGVSEQTTEGPTGGSAIDKAREQEKKETKTDNKTKENTTGDEYNLDGSKKEGDKWYEKKAWKESGIGSIVNAVKEIRKGIKKRKAKRLDEARKAYGTDAETYAQAKLLDRESKKEDRRRAKREKDAKKRDKFYKDRSSKIIKNL
tara:strand:- start:44 stop:625 length:582 start_codon:yes stop_codon:yes gene_type:complete